MAQGGIHSHENKIKGKGGGGSCEKRQAGRGSGGGARIGAGKDRGSDGKAKGGSECVSLSSGAPVLRPAASVGPEPGPRRHRPAAANTGSSS